MANKILKSEIKDWLYSFLNQQYFDPNQNKNKCAPAFTGDFLNDELFKRFGVYQIGLAVCLDELVAEGQIEEISVQDLIRGREGSFSVYRYRYKTAASGWPCP